MKCNHWVAIWVGWLLLWSNVLTVQAQSTIIIDSNEARLRFPRNITFTLKVHSSAEIDQVQLIYHTNGRSCLNSTGRKDVDIHKGVALTAEWIWDLVQADNLPPGSVVTWQWQVRDSTGITLLTPEQKINIEDPDYTWQTIQSNGITVFWSRGDAVFGQTVLNTAAASLARLVKDIGISGPQAVRLMVYPNSQELRSAALHLPEWTGGVAFPEYSTVMIGLGPDDTDYINDIVPHELAHLVIDQRIDNCQGNQLPTWLSEGLATFAEGAASVDSKNSVQSALKHDQAPALTTLTAGFAEESDRAALSYAQSGMVVAFMVDTYGPKKLDEFLEQIKQGVLTDKALLVVYGLDTTGIDQAWRAFMGYGTAPSASSSTTPTGKAVRTAVPTFSLVSAASATPLPTATLQPSFTATSAPTQTAIPVTPSTAPIPSAPAEQTAEGDQPAWIWILAGTIVVGLVTYSGFRLVRKR